MSGGFEEREPSGEAVGRRLGLTGGAQATLVSFEGEHATIELTSAWPPGATVELVLLGAPARLKVRRCQRVAERDSDGVLFRIDGRWLSLSRAQRQALEESTAKRG